MIELYSVLYKIVVGNNNTNIISILYNEKYFSSLLHMFLMIKKEDVDRHNEPIILVIIGNIFY